LGFRFEVRLSNGEWRVLSPYLPGVRLKEVQALKVDWLDLIRLAEVQRFLRQWGDALWPGFRADEVPFLLVGEEQEVLVNHPHPPAGFQPYRGRLPVSLSILVGPRRRSWGKQDAPARTTLLGGVPVVCLGPRPYWYALPGQGTARDSLEALFRLEQIIHEAFHVFLWRTQGVVPPPKSPFSSSTMLRMDLATLRLGECWLLAKGLEASAAERPQFIKDFLALRYRRWNLLRSFFPSLVQAEEEYERAEGLASFVQALASEIGSQTYQPRLLLSTDPFFEGWEAREQEWLEEIKERLSDSRTLLQFFPEGKIAAAAWAQLWLLRRLTPAWWSPLKEAHYFPTRALACLVGYPWADEEKQVSLGEETYNRRGLTQIEEKLKELKRAALIEQEKARTRLEAPPGVALTAEFFLSGPFYNLAPFDWEMGEWIPVQNFGLRLPDLEAHFADGWLIKAHPFEREGETAPSSGFKLYLRGSVGEPAEVLYLCQSSEGFRLLGKKVRIRGNRLAAWAAREGITVHWPEGHADRDQMAPPPLSVASPAKPKGEEVTAMKSRMHRGWWKVVPLAGLLGLPNTVALAQAEGVEVNGTLTGIYESIADGSQQEVSLLLEPEGGEEGQAKWYILDDQDYELAITFYDPAGRLVRAGLLDRDGEVVYTVEGPPEGTDQLTLTRNGKVGETLGGGVTIPVDWLPEGFELKIFYEFGDGIPVEVIFKGKAKEKPKRGGLKVKVFRGEDNQPLAQADVTIYRASKPNEQQTNLTDPQGTAEFQGLDIGDDYVAEVEGPGVRCHLKKESIVVAEGSTSIINLYSYQHHPIVGTLQFQYSDGSPAEGPGEDVVIELLQNGQVVQGGAVGQQPDGSYQYTIGPPPPAGDYTLRATLQTTGETNSGPVTVPNNCDPTLGVAPGGAHSDVTGPTLTLTVPEEQAGEGESGGP